MIDPGGEELTCTECNSTNVRSFEMVNAEGTTVQYNIQSELAERCSPPNHPEGALLGMSLAVFSFLAGLIGGVGGLLWGYKAGFGFATILSGLVGFVVGYFLIYKLIKIFWLYVLGGNRKIETYNSNYANWQKTWMCLKCGAEFR